LMLCLHKHSIGACSQMGPTMDPRSFIRTHVDVVVRGLLVRPDDAAQQTPPAPKKKKAPKPS
jgi:hypothetical protein